MSEGKVVQEIDRQIGEAFAEIRMLQRCCGDELSVKVNVSIYRLLCILILPYGQELYAMTEWMRS